MRKTSEEKGHRHKSRIFGFISKLMLVERGEKGRKSQSDTRVEFPQRERERMRKRLRERE